LDTVENEDLDEAHGIITNAVIGCECCVYPVVDHIPVLIAGERSREAVRALQAKQIDRARNLLLELDDFRASHFDDLFQRTGSPSYRELLAVLSQDTEAHNFLFRFSDPTYRTIEALISSLRDGWNDDGMVLDLCGGSGHTTRLLAKLAGAHRHVLADLYYWKLWLASKITVPTCDTVCCDANSPLPFKEDEFSAVLLADAFPYVWQKQLCASEMERISRNHGMVIMPHLHTSNGWNYSAGNTLTPAAYANLFHRMQPRLYDDQVMLDNLLDNSIVDLAGNVPAEELRESPSITLIAHSGAYGFTSRAVAEPHEIFGVLALNPIYRTQSAGSETIIHLACPSEDYANEYAAQLRYLPERMTLSVDLSQPLTPALFGKDYKELVRRKILLDVPPGYC
jgi:SAM-dependent methyltransferase